MSVRALDETQQRLKVELIFATLHMGCETGGEIISVWVFRGDLYYQVDERVAIGK